MKKVCAYCERRITGGRFKSRHTGEVYCLRPDCAVKGKRIRTKRKAGK